MISCASTQSIPAEDEGITYDMESMKIKLSEKDLIKEEEPQRDIRTLDRNTIATNIPSDSVLSSNAELYLVRIANQQYVASRTEENTLLESSFTIRDDDGFITIESKKPFTGIGINDSVSVSVYSEDMDGYMEYIFSTLKTTDVRALYPSDEEYVQFFNHKSGIIGEGKLYTATFPTSDEKLEIITALAAKYGIRTVINYSDRSFEIGSCEVYQVSDPRQLVLTLIDTEGPYLIISKPDTNTSLVMALLEALAGTRLDAIEECFMRYFESKYSLTNSDRRYDIIRSWFERELMKITGASALEDKALLHLSVSYLKNNLSLTTNDISSLRLALR
ncbi:MAG: hypothetical protein ACI4NM_04145 [Bullifex sp.]